MQQGLYKALTGKDGKTKTMKVDEWEELELRCISTIQLCIADNIINNVMNEDFASDLWKLEKLYVAKSLIKQITSEAVVVPTKDGKRRGSHGTHECVQWVFGSIEES